MGNTSSGVKFTPSDGFFFTDAAKQGNIDVLSLFLRKNPALVFSTTQDKNTAWHYASSYGHTNVIELLVAVAKEAAVSNTFDPIAKVVNSQNGKGQTALSLACQGGHFTCVRTLLENGADPLIVDSTGLSTFHYAALTPHGGCIQLILKKIGLWGPNGPRPPAASDAQMLK